MRAIFRRPADAAQRRREVFAVDVLHRQEQPSVALADVVDATDVRMRHLSRDADFFMETGEPHGVVRECGADELERHRLGEPEIVGTVDLAHAAAPEQRRNPVAVVENRAGLELPVIDRGRRSEPPLGRAERGARRLRRERCRVRRCGLGIGWVDPSGALRFSAALVIARRHALRERQSRSSLSTTAVHARWTEDRNLS